MFVSPSRIRNANNEFQGHFHRVLCVCSVGMLRSPTLAWLLSGDPWNYNTRSCGIEVNHAVIILDQVLLTWADVVICMERRHVHEVEQMLAKMKKKGRPANPLVLNFNIPDDYCFRDPRLIARLREEAVTLENLVGFSSAVIPEPISDNQTK